jgi:hypothetical protein
MNPVWNDRFEPKAPRGEQLDLGERPRVVIFEGGDSPAVEVIELPEGVSLGTRFRHLGTRWQVMATRTGDRVLIARPAEP